MRITMPLIGLSLITLMLIPLGVSSSLVQIQPTPTLTVTPTSQPAPPVLIYPPDGAVLTHSITVQDLQYTTTGFMTHITVTGGDFAAHGCAAFYSECQPLDFENEDVLLPDGAYTWHVSTWKPLGTAISETGHFRIDTSNSDNLPLLLSATPSPTRIPAKPTPRGK